MYCECIRPNKLKQEANGQPFTVCAKSLGGCGKEVKSKVIHGARAKIFVNGVEVGSCDDISYSVNKDANLSNTVDLTGIDVPWAGGISGHFPVPVKLCEACEGSGMDIRCYGGHPIEVKCDICNGDGYVED
jgi:hypothetical protein